MKHRQSVFGSLLLYSALTIRAQSGSRPLKSAWAVNPSAAKSSIVFDGESHSDTLPISNVPAACPQREDRHA